MLGLYRYGLTIFEEKYLTKIIMKIKRKKRSIQENNRNFKTPEESFKTRSIK